jgi:uncharacterized membrane protein
VLERAYRYFWTPGYNVVNTLTYGIILAGCVYLIIAVLRKREFRIDKSFLTATLPFIFFGSTARELVDRGFGVYPGYAPYPGNFWLVAPGIYLSMFLLTSFVLAVTVFFFRERYFLPMASFGVLLSSYNLYLIAAHITTLKWFFVSLLSFLLSAAASYLILGGLGRSLLSGRDSFNANFLLLSAHLLDASATFVGVDFMGYSEKHVLPNVLIEKVGSAAVMFPLKFIVVVAAIYVIDREYAKDELSRRFVKFAVLVLGLGPALRDLTLIALR